jgi:hypothetical protein
MSKKDLLKEAIADAKAVKETALANAKLALEEAFTPKLQSMISKKIAEELDDEELEEMDASSGIGADDDEVSYVDNETENDDALTEEDDEMESELDLEEMEDEMESELEEEEMDYEDELELDLDEIIRELEDENEMESELEEDEMDYEDELDLEEMEDEEEFDLNEVIRALKEMENETEMEDESDEVEDMAAELEEAYKTIKSLQSTINEVNLLNAKLLYTNKLFRTFDLNESQKVKVLENFDRSTSVREVKLVFSTLAENLNVVKKSRKVVKEGLASKSVGVAPKKQIISEGTELANRWMKLANIKK